MKKLSIIIPQYKEDCKGALDSIQLQQGIKFEDLEVIIVNDCSKWQIDKSVVKNYGFEIRFMRTPQNAGAGVARQYGVDRAKGRYVLFLDADDKLFSCISLRPIMNYTRKANLIIGKFYNEGRNEVINDLTWVHGKFYKRSWLKNRNIRFADDIRVNEDACFNLLARQLADKPKDCEEWNDIITFWVANPNSITRENRSKFIVDGYSDYLKGKLWGLRRLRQENRDEQLKFTLLDTVVYTYYCLQQKEMVEAKKKRKEYEKQLMLIVKEFWKYWVKIPEESINAHLLEVVRKFYGYKDYKLHETFDKFKIKLYNIEL